MALPGQALGAFFPQKRQTMALLISSTSLLAHTYLFVTLKAALKAFLGTRLKFSFSLLPASRSHCTFPVWFLEATTFTAHHAPVWLLHSHSPGTGLCPRRRQGTSEKACRLLGCQSLGSTKHFVGCLSLFLRHGIDLDNLLVIHFLEAKTQTACKLAELIWRMCDLSTLSTFYWFLVCCVLPCSYQLLRRQTGHGLPAW